MKRILNILIFLGAWVVTIQAQDNVQVLPSSRIWLEGSSSVNEFTCTLTNAKEIDLDILDITDSSLGEHPFSVTVGFPVKLLDCGQKAMNQDMFDALKSDSFPSINFKLTSVNQIPATETNNGSFTLYKVNGILTVAGVSREVEMTTKAHKPETNTPHKIIGSYQIDMLDYNVEPPTALWGLIKANKNIVIHFDAEIKIF